MKVQIEFDTREEMEDWKSEMTWKVLVNCDMCNKFSNGQICKERYNYDTPNMSCCEIKSIFLDKICHVTADSPLKISEKLRGK